MLPDVVSLAIRQIKVDEWGPPGPPPLVAYGDPITHGPPWTIGWGSTGPDITEGTVWTLAQAESAIEIRCAALEVALHSILAPLNAPRGAVLINMAYNLGLRGLYSFSGMLTAVKDGLWNTAAAHMMTSLWAKQVPRRAKYLAAQMATGVEHAP
jgi:lysozyme